VLEIEIEQLVAYALRVRSQLSLCKAQYSKSLEGGIRLRKAVGIARGHEAKNQQAHLQSATGKRKEKER